MLSSGWNPRLLFGLLLQQENKHTGKKNIQGEDEENAP
jgi:hypothetical protein